MCVCAYYIMKRNEFLMGLRGKFCFVLVRIPTHIIVTKYQGLHLSNPLDILVSPKLHRLLLRWFLDNFSFRFRVRIPFSFRHYGDLLSHPYDYHKETVWTAYKHLCSLVMLV